MYFTECASTCATSHKVLVAKCLIYKAKLVDYESSGVPQPLNYG